MKYALLREVKKTTFGGDKAGAIEIKNIKAALAKKYLSKGGIEIDNFESHFNAAKKAILKGDMQRKQMPVIKDANIEELEAFLDSKADAKKTKVAIKELKPVQSQVYFDKTANSIIKFGIKKSLKVLPKKHFIINKDNRILDGHHRYLTLMLLNPDVQVTVFKIDLPLKEVIKLTNEFTKKIGNKPNK